MDHEHPNEYDVPHLSGSNPWQAHVLGSLVAHLLSVGKPYLIKSSIKIHVVINHILPRTYRHLNLKKKTTREKLEL